MDWVEQHQQQRVILSLHFRSTSRRCAKKRWIKKAIGEAVMYSPFLGQLSRLYPSSATALPPNDTSRLPARQWRREVGGILAGPHATLMMSGMIWVECSYSGHWIHGGRIERG